MWARVEVFMCLGVYVGTLGVFMLSNLRGPSSPFPLNPSLSPLPSPS